MFLLREQMKVNYQDVNFVTLSNPNLLNGFTVLQTESEIHFTHFSEGIKTIFRIRRDPTYESFLLSFCFRAEFPELVFNVSFFFSVSICQFFLERRQEIDTN